MRPGLQSWENYVMSTILILICSFVISSITLLVVAKHQRNPGAWNLTIFAVSSVLGGLTNFLIYTAGVPFRSAFSLILYGLVLTAFSAQVMLILENTEYSTWLKPSWLALFALIPLASLALSFTRPGGSLFATDSIPGGSRLLAPDNPAGLINTIYVNLLMLAALFLLAQNLSLKTLINRHQTYVVMTGITLALLINNNFFASSFAPFHELKLIGLLFCGAANIASYKLYGATAHKQISREKVFENMSDGVIVLDNANLIVDVNTAAEKIIGIPGIRLSGQPAEEIFIDWPNLANSLGDTRDLNLKGSVKIKDKWTYLNINISPLKDGAGKQFGKMILWRDITERRVAEDARQQARDEMFILLHSITSAASRALNLDDFLSESIYQIVYSSRSQSIAVYLLEEHARASSQRNLILAAQHGIAIDPDGPMNAIPESLEIVKLAMEQGEPLLIADTQTDARLPVAMRAMGPMSLLMLPMQLESQSLGLISLTRSGDTPYNPEEIARLRAVADEIASFVYSNRQRQLSIALAERQRLVRDLHDSVTQKLYALVMLSEATRAGMAAGVTDMPEKVIARIAENARQALKEMRLFLFQMQPVDFAREGMVAALRQRLSAVEGRADINARLTADDNISLPLEKELAIYFIAQEALNNVLKHAKAKNVNVFLKNRKASFVLEVEDNGCGFDPKITNSAGIGMKSMRERTEQIGGKFKITSAKGKGTKITVTLKNNLITD